MKRAKKSPRKFFAASVLEILRARMRAYLDKTQDSFRMSIANSFQSGKGTQGDASLRGTRRITPANGNVFLDLGFPPDMAVELKKKSDESLGREKRDRPESCD
jgi:hypothetical protein